MSITIRVTEWLSVRKRAEDLRILYGLVAPSPALRLLDVGGGAGAATERFAAGCGQVVVLEPNRKKLAVGRRRRPAIRFEEGRGEAIPFPDESFDRVVAVVAFHHAEDQEKVLREMRRVLRVSGKIVLAELPHSRVPNRLARRIGGLRHGAAASFLDPGGLVAMLEANGFDNVTTQPGSTCYFVTATK